MTSLFFETFRKLRKVESEKQDSSEVTQPDKSTAAEGFDHESLPQIRNPDHEKLLQTLHDLRSPNLAINMIASQLAGRRRTQKSSYLVQAPISDLRFLPAPDTGFHYMLTEEEFRTLANCAQRINAIINEEMPKRMSLNEAIEALVADKRYEYHTDKNIEIRFMNLENIELNSRFSPRHLVRILSNLINNSVEAKREAKLSGNASEILEVEVSIIDSRTIYVSDNGRGIPKEIIHILGRRPITAHKGNLVNAGTGIGIYAAKQMLVQQGGDLHIETSVIQGALIEIRLP